MRRSGASRWRPVAILLAIGCVALAGCGDDSPSSPTVLEIGDDAVSAVDVDQWVQLKTNLGGGASPRLVPPAYAACVSKLRKDAPSDGQRPPTADLRRQCQRQLADLVTLLIEDRWIRQEAKRQHITIDAAALQRTLAERKRVMTASLDQSQPANRRRLATFLRVLREFETSQQLKAKLEAELIGNPADITDQQVQAEYGAHGKRFAAPSRRSIRILQLKTKAEAKRAKRALRSGVGWKAFPSPPELDGQTPVVDGRTTLSSDRGDDALLKAVFATSRGSVGGPVPTDGGWYVFAVDGTESGDQSLAATRDAIRTRLFDQHEYRLRRAFVNRYRGATVCDRAYAVVQCGAIRTL